VKILYGVQGTGHGHVVRSREMVRELKARGHDVHCVLTARRQGSFPGMEVFEPCTVFRGFTGVAGGGRIRTVRTLFGLRIRRFFRDVRSFDPSGFDLAITDFEPATGWIARRHGLPSVGLGHLYAYCYPVPVPRRSLPARLLLRAFIPIYTPVRTPIGINWHHFGTPSLPPTIPRDVRPDRESRDDRVVVYLPGESEGQILALLAQLRDHHFYVYGRTAPRDEGNVHFRRYDREGFLGDLFQSCGVVANAGFSLASEALHHGKRILVRPVRRQPEQYLNGKLLERLRLGTVVSELTPQVLRSWLATPAPAPMRYPDVVRPFVEWIEHGNWNRPAELVRRVWSEVTWPPTSPSPLPL
jgi:uncharacterized protein (TIGR00661 family)